MNFFAIWFALYILSESLAFLNAEVQMSNPSVCACVCVCVCVCVKKKAHKQAQTHILTSSIHIMLSSLLTQKASISRCTFFSLQGELKRRWGLLFCLSPNDEFMHLKRSFVTRELALCACTLSALPDGLYII